MPFGNQEEPQNVESRRRAAWWFPKYGYCLGAGRLHTGRPCSSCFEACHRISSTKWLVHFKGFPLARLQCPNLCVWQTFQKGYSNQTCSFQKYISWGLCCLSRLFVPKSYWQTFAWSKAGFQRRGFGWSSNHKRAAFQNETPKSCWLWCH